MTFKTLRRYRLDFIVTGLLGLIILVLTLLPHGQTPNTLGVDKLHHLLAFGALTLPIGLLRRSLLWVAALCSAILGGLIEIIQPYTGRSGDLHDFLADLMGIGLAVLIILIYHAIYKPRHG